MMRSSRSLRIQENNEIDEDCDAVLELVIYGARNFMIPSLPGRYYAVAWVEPYEEYKTPICVNMRNPTWDWMLKIPLPTSMDDWVLKLEVVRLDCMNEIGTSTGVLVVGKAKISLPPHFSKLIGGNVALTRIVGYDEKLTGEIQVDMKVIKKKKRTIII